MLSNKQINVIAAMNNNRVIGDRGTIPWDCKADMKHFKQTTTGHSCVMGRKTFDSLPKLLPGRQMVVITSQPHVSDDENVVYVSSVEDALNACVTEEVYVIGGSQIYEMFMPYADKLVLTIVDDNSLGDTFFPYFEENDYQQNWVGSGEGCLFYEFDKKR